MPPAPRLRTQPFVLFWAALGLILKLLVIVVEAVSA